MQTVPDILTAALPLCTGHAEVGRSFWFVAMYWFTLDEHHGSG
jgi:hypothetical protein